MKKRLLETSNPSKEEKILQFKNKTEQSIKDFYSHIVRDNNLLEINILFFISIMSLVCTFSLFINSKSPNINLNYIQNWIFLTIAIFIYLFSYVNLTIIFYKFFYDIKYKKIYKVLTFNSSMFIIFNIIFIFNIIIRSMFLYSFWIGFSLFSYILLNFAILKINFEKSFLFSFIVAVVLPTLSIWFLGSLFILITQ